MSFKNKILNINKDLIKRKNFTKSEIKKIILKSIIHNKNLKPLTRSNAYYKLSRLNLNTSISRQNNNICLLTGRIGGVFKKTHLSRHTMKKLGISGNLQNIKIITW
jgi:ribosomal protein S14